MSNTNPTSLNYKNLTPIEQELIRLEITLLEQRILHLENLQYRLRQFSIAIWVAALSVGIGITPGVTTNFFLIGISSFIPAIFLYLDAWYATMAQNFRSRRNEITYFLNTDKYTVRSKRERYNHNEEDKNEAPDKLFLLDLNGDLSLRDSKIIEYRRSLIVKLTRTVRLCFYGLQMLGSFIILSSKLSDIKNSPKYYACIVLVPVLFGFLYWLRNLKKSSLSKGLPAESKKQFTEIADREIYPIEIQ